MSAILVQPDVKVSDGFLDERVDPSVSLLETEPVNPLTQEALDLFVACDRVDAMPADPVREQALAELLARVNSFEAGFGPEEKDSALQEALELSI